MFGGFFRGVDDDDAFFRDSFAAHRACMNHLFSDSFGSSPYLANKAGGERSLDQRGRPALMNNQQEMSHSLLPLGSFGGMAASFPLVPFGSMAMNFPFVPFGSFGGMDMDLRDPFSAMDRMMSNMRNTMMQLQQNFDKMSLDPNAHTFTSSSMMSYSKKGDAPPNVFQASAQTRTAPGGIKETRKALKDSESGLEKISIGHHIKDRAHVIQKARNNKTGGEELNQEFVNLDEAEAHAFDEEWQKEIMRFKPSATRNNLDAPRHRNIHHVTREDGARREKMLPRTAIEGPRRPRSSLEKLNIKGSHVPLKNSKK